MERSVVTILFSVGMLLAAEASLARTWLVEKDGSGEFMVIQDAVDAAASGDTIRVGPGRFDDKVYATSVGWSDSVRVLVTQNELTLIGTGPETIIGQTIPWTSEQGQHKGVVASDYWGNTVVRISGFRFENMRDAIFTSHENAGQDIIVVDDCTFSGNLYSIALIGDGGVADVSNCIFGFAPVSGTQVILWNQRRIGIIGCSFSLSDSESSSQRSVSLINVSSAAVESCSFLEGSTGLVAAQGGPVIVRDCVFDGQSNDAIYPEIMSDISIEDCIFRNQTRVLSSGANNNRVSMTGSVVEDVSDCAILMSYFGSLTVSNCDFAAGARGVVYVQDTPNCIAPRHFDMASNYWSTSDPDSIPMLIRDRNDSDQACYFIDYEPFLPISTPVKEESFGGVKSMFR